MAASTWYYWTTNSPLSTSTCNTAVTESSSPWVRWTDTTTYIANGATDEIWGTWTNGTLSISDCASGSTWSYWVLDGSGVAVAGRINGEQVVPITGEQNEQRRVRMEQMAREAEERRTEEGKRRQEAEERALQLLLESLTETQAEVFKATGAIPVECSSGRKYHIRKGMAANVHELNDKGETARRLCFLPSNCPVHDVMLAQKLMLETCEEDARRIANYS